MIDVENSKDSNSIVIIDGLNLFVKHFCANPATTSSGLLVGGVVGFIKFIDWVIANMSPQKIYVVWEKSGGSSKRKSIYPEYKSNRVKLKGLTESNIKPNSNSSKIVGDEQNKQKQLLILVDLLKYLPVCQIYHSECECDDVIAYMVRQRFVNNKAKKIVVSSDKDFYQLLEQPDVVIYDHMKKSYIGTNDVVQRFGIHPRNFVLARTIDGDDSDNIQGVHGIGFKTLIKAFPEFGDESKDLTIQMLMESSKQAIENNNSSSNKKKQSSTKVYESILSNEDIIKRNWKLMYLGLGIMTGVQTLKIDDNINKFEPKFDYLGLVKALLREEIVLSLDFDLMSSRIRNSSLIS